MLSLIGKLLVKAGMWFVAHPDEARAVVEDGAQLWHARQAAKAAKAAK